MHERDTDPAAHFGDRLAAHVAARESQVVVGLDPDPDALWVSPGWDSSPGASAPEPAQAVLAHCRALIDAAAPACVAAKAQLACFERLGPPGWQVLFDVVAHARNAGLLVIADGKRGDVPVSARAYAQAMLDPARASEGAPGGLGADALTVNPLLGRDALEPLLATARDHGAGLFLLVRTSNPGAADLQDLELSEGGALWERLAQMVDHAGRPGARSGLADVGAVVGATAPHHLARMRALMPRAVFLLPGVGAQGGRLEELAPAWAPGCAAALIAASRSIADAHRQAGGPPERAARAEAERLRALAWKLSS